MKLESPSHNDDEILQGISHVSSSIKGLNTENPIRMSIDETNLNSSPIKSQEHSPSFQNMGLNNIDFQHSTPGGMSARDEEDEDQFERSLCAPLQKDELENEINDACEKMEQTEKFGDLNQSAKENE